MKHLIIVVITLMVIVSSACTPLAQPQPAEAQVIDPSPTTAATVSAAGEETDVKDLVENFGQRLKLVSLLAPSAAQDLQKQYAEFVSASLLETWRNDISKAPGRMVSSPWPDRIEITSLAKETPDRYVIDGFVIEITSTEIGTGKAADKIPVHIVVGRDQGHWLITEYVEEH